MSIRGAFESCVRCFVDVCHPSCIERASWTAKQRAAFDRYDDQQEAREMLSLAVPLSLEAPVPSQRYHRKVADLTGEWFGSLYVIGPSIRGRENWRWMAREWRAVCMCGREIVVSASHLRRGQRRCGPCANAQRARERPTTRRIAGELVSEIAKRAGLPVSTIRTRLRRGVPVAELAAPRKRPPTSGNRRKAA